MNSVTLRQSSLGIISIFLVITILFYKTLNTYFVQDDFFLLLISKLYTLNDLFNFFLPRYDTVWYRPLSSQVFFGFGQLIFGYQPFLYHVVVFLTHLLTTYAIYYFFLSEYNIKTVAVLSALLYGIHNIHTVSLSWLAAFSFISAPLFIVLAFIFYKKKNLFISLVFYILGLLTSEVVIIYFFLLVVDSFSNKALKKSTLLMFSIPIIVIIFARFLFFPTTQKSQLYLFSFSPHFLSNLKFYIIRLVGIPMLVDEMPHLLKNFTFTMGVIILLALLMGLIRLCKYRMPIKILVYWSGVAFMGMIPFLLMPNHIAPHYLSFSLIGFVIVIAWLIFHGSLFFPVYIQKIYLGIIIGTFILLQIISINWTLQTHEIFRRAELSRRLIAEKTYDHKIGSEEYFSLGAGSAEEIFK